MNVVSTYIPDQDGHSVEWVEVLRMISNLLPFLDSKQFFFPLYMHCNANLLFSKSFKFESGDVMN